jgi:hypothetical protein
MAKAYLRRRDEDFWAWEEVQERLRMPEEDGA